MDGLGSVSCALIGYGRWGKVLAGAIDRAPHLRLRHVYSRTLCEPPITTNSLWEVFNDPDVDAVVVACPLATRARIITMALRAGKHVLCEKPLALSAEDAHDLLEHAKAAQRTLMVDYVHALGPTMDLLLDRIGESGRPKRLEVDLYQPGPLATPENAVTALVSHALAIVFRLVGPARFDTWLTRTMPDECGEYAASFIAEGVSVGTVDVRVVLAAPEMRRHVRFFGDRCSFEADLVHRSITTLNYDDLIERTRAPTFTERIETPSDDLSFVMDRFSDLVLRRRQSSTIDDTWVQDWMQRLFPTALPSRDNAQ